MDRPRLGNIYVFPVEGDQERKMEFKLFIIGMTILYLVLGFTVLGWF